MGWQWVEELRLSAAADFAVADLDRNSLASGWQRWWSGGGCQPLGQPPDPPGYPVLRFDAQFVWVPAKEWNHGHNSPIYDEYETQYAKVLTLPRKQAHQDDSNNPPQPICECVKFTSLYFGLRIILVYPNPL